MPGAVMEGRERSRIIQKSFLFYTFLTSFLQSRGLSLVLLHGNGIEKPKALTTDRNFFIPSFALFAKDF